MPAGAPAVLFSVRAASFKTKQKFDPVDPWANDGDAEMLKDEDQVKEVKDEPEQQA